MPGRFCVAAIAILGVLAATAGTAGARGGNHGCEDGRMFSSHFFASGDNIVVGFFTEEVKFPPDIQENVVSENTGNDGSGPSGLNCGKGGVTLFESRLGPGNDSVRLDAVGLQNKYPEPPQPLPRGVATLLIGAAGNDVIRGHSGFDDISGGGGNEVILPFEGRDRVRAGAGRDLIRTRDGRKDNVNCGPGEDRVRADANDDVHGCERVIVR